MQKIHDEEIHKYTRTHI